MTTTRHIAGPMEDRVQHCVICGHVICDYRGAVSPDPEWRPSGFREGEVFIRGNMTSTTPIDEDFEDCTP